MAKRLKAFVRYDGSGRIVPSSVILAANKPKVGNWKEIDANKCCNYAPPTNPFNFDITANWSLTTPSVVDESSFRTFLESGEDGEGNINSLTDVVITDFSLVGNRLTCNLTANTGFGDLYLSYMDITDITSFGNLQIIESLYLYGNNILSVDNTTWPIGVANLDLSNNSIISVDNVTWPSTINGYLALSANLLTSVNDVIWPSSLQTLYVANNSINSFNPSTPLPSGIISIYLSYNPLTYFHPNIPLPDSINHLQLNNNQITAVGYTASEPWANAMSVIPGRGNVYFNNNVDSVSGTNLETVLIAKGWAVTV